MIMFWTVKVLQRSFRESLIYSAKLDFRVTMKNNASPPFWCDKGYGIRSKITNICFHIFSTLLPNFIEIDFKLLPNFIEIDFKIAIYANFSLWGHYDIIESVESGQKSPKLVFIFSEHFYQVSLKSIQKSAIYAKFSILGVSWSSIMMS